MLNELRILESLQSINEQGMSQEDIIASLEKDYGKIKISKLGSGETFLDLQKAESAIIKKVGKNLIVVFSGSMDAGFPSKLGSWSKKVESAYKKELKKRTKYGGDEWDDSDGWVIISSVKLTDKQIEGSFSAFRWKVDKEFKVKVGGVDYYAYAGVSSV